MFLAKKKFLFTQSVYKKKHLKDYLEDVKKSQSSYLLTPIGL